MHHIVAADGDDYHISVGNCLFLRICKALYLIHKVGGVIARNCVVRYLAAKIIAAYIAIVVFYTARAETACGYAVAKHHHALG